MSKKIVIPFTNFMKEKIAQGIKTATSRNKKYGEEGDWFTLFERKFELFSVYKIKLGDVGKHYWSVEGFNTPAEFFAYWKDLHKRKGLELDKFVWFHQFREKLRQ
jgi:hypothetical protein